jgi:ribosomal protein S18 acetylase RimI-like enzyme
MKPMPRISEDLVVELSWRLAQPSDVADIVSLVESAYRGEASRAGWTTEADLIDGQRTDQAMVEELLALPGSLFVLAEGPTGLVGSCHLRLEGQVAHFGMFAVAPKAQRAGVGRRLLGQAQAHARAQGATRMRLSVLSQREELIAWYRRRGFEPTGETEAFPYGNPRYGLPRRDDLSFVVLEAPL